MSPGCLVGDRYGSTTFYFLPGGQNFLNISRPYIHRTIRDSNFLFCWTQECLVRGGCRTTTFYFLPEGQNFLNISWPYIHRTIRDSKFLLLSKTFLRTQGCLIRGRCEAPTFYFLPGSQYFLNFRGLIFRLLRSFLRIQGWGQSNGFPFSLYLLPFESTKSTPSCLVKRQKASCRLLWRYAFFFFFSPTLFFYPLYLENGKRKFFFLETKVFSSARNAW